MQRDMAALACHSLGAADLASFFLLQQQGPIVHAEPYPAGGGVAGLEHQAEAGGGEGRDERKERRLASNRESARRARARRRGQLDELSLRAAELRAANAQLAVKLNRVAAALTRAAGESARLREEERGLRERLAAAAATATATAAAPEGGSDNDDDKAGTPNEGLENREKIRI